MYFDPSHFRALFAGLIAIFALPVSAQSVSSVSADDAMQVETVEADEPSESKSPSRAQVYSLGTLAGGVLGGMALMGIALGSDNRLESQGDRVLAAAGRAVFLGGFWVGPSFGHFYAEDHRQAWVGLGIRTVGLVLVAVGPSIRFTDPPEGGYRDPSWVSTIGVLVVTGSAGYDAATAAQSAKEYNEAQTLEARVAPLVGPRAEQVGLALRVQL